MARRFAAVGLLVLGLVLVASPRADAHALLRASDPAPGAQLDRAPGAVVLSFTETPDPSLSVVHVLDTGGGTVEKGKATVVPGRRDSLTVSLPGDLPRGSYTVTWRTTSSVDGHTTAGAFAFGVQVPANAVAAQSAPRTRPPSPLSVAGRWGLYLGLAVIVGGARFSSATRKRLALAWLLAAAGAAALTVELLRDSHAGVSTLVSSTTGTKLAVEVGAVALTGLAVAVAPALAVVAAAGALLARAWAGHAAASSAPWLTIGTQWIHLVAIGVWIGGLPWLAAALRTAAPGNRGAIARRFSRTATVALLVVVASGTARAISEVGSWRGLFDTSFGRTLLIKVAIVAVVIALGTFNRFRGAPRISVAAEALTGVAVLAVTAVLAGFPPATSVRAAGPPSRVVATGHDFGTTVRVRLETTPGTPGPNHFSLSATDYDSGKPVAAASVSLRVAPADRGDVAPTTIALARAGTRWQADSTAIALGGRWRVVVVIQRASGAIEVPITLSTRQPAQRITEQRTAGLPTIYTITAGARRVQAYVDPGRAGKNTIHFTFFDPAGAETPTDVVSVSARRVGGATTSLEVRRLGPGHVVADAPLSRGTWRFMARTADGFAPAFSQAIG